MSRGKSPPFSIFTLSWTFSLPDVITTDWGTGYDVVVIAANFLFNIVSDCEYQTSQQILIEKAAEALHPGGYLFIDYGYTLRPEEWLESPDDRVIFERTDSLGTVGKMILADNTFDRNLPVSPKIWTDRSNGQSFFVEAPETKHFPLLEEIHAYLFGAGFSVQAEYGDYLRFPIGENTNRAIIRAKKQLN